jgi:uncharacterized membrane protein YeiH
MIHEIYFLDLLGTLTFAFYGAYVGMQKKFDIFGVFVVAFLTAVGGGTIREILLGHLPAYFSDIYYLVAIVFGIIFSIILYPAFHKINRYALIVDAIGLVTFAFIGASHAHDAGLGAFGIIFLATITAVGGGLLRDIAIAETPQIFYKDFYASPAIFLGILYVLFQTSIQSSLVVYGIIICALILRLIAIYFKLNLWGPWRKIG